MKSLRALTLLATVSGVHAMADTTVAPVAVYVPTDFAQYAPLNARDMVERIPGFRLSNSRGSDESRGLGQATENVLINGQRISGKSASAADTLERIPASTVERIELREGATLDIPGLSGLVVNVIAEADGISGTWDYRARIIDGQKPLLAGGEIALAGQNGALGWIFNANALPRGSAGSGEETTFDPFGAMLETRRITEKNLFPDLEGSVGFALDAGVRPDCQSQCRVCKRKRDQREISDRAVAEDETLRQFIQDIDESTTLELNGDIEFDVQSGRAKIIGVYSDRNSPFTSSRDRLDQFGETSETSFFRQISDETELIVRGEYTWSALGGSWDASIESAINTLDSQSILLEASGGAALQAVDIGDATAAVEETRSEAFVTYSRSLSDALQLQVSLGTEVSELVSSGANGQSRMFTRPKGGATLSWQYNDATTLNARINRRVGQLDFFDFVSQLDLNDGDNQVGNANIVPEQSWRTELEIERQFGAWGAGNVVVFAEALEDIVDQVPIGTGEGPGNIESGARIGIELEGTLSFDRLGVDGAQLVYSAIAQDSVIEDPLTGEDRAINGDNPIELELEFRHDISGTDLAWGFEMSPQISGDSLRVDSIRSDRELPGRYSLFAEHKNLWGLTGRAEFFRLFGNVEKEKRERFTPDRTGALVEIERTRLEETPILILELSGKF